MIRLLPDGCTFKRSHPEFTARKYPDMKYFRLVIITVFISFSACVGNAQQPDNTRPMYGDVQKSEAFQKTDERFIQNAIEQCGTRDSAVNLYLDRAWRYFYNNDLQMAMKRFNQAWLLNAEAPDTYFGFAALLDSKGDYVASARFYKTGMSKDKAGKRALVC